MARVRSVIRDSMDAGSMFIVRGSMSASTGVAPAWRIALTVAQNVMALVMTSSPGSRSRQRIERCRALVQELTAIACASPPLYWRKLSSNRATFGPVPIQPERSESTTSATSCSSMTGAPKTRNFVRLPEASCVGALGARVESAEGVWAESPPLVAPSRA